MQSEVLKGRGGMALGWHGTRRREKMIKRRVKRKADAAGGGKLDS